MRLRIFTKLIFISILILSACSSLQGEVDPFGSEGGFSLGSSGDEDTIQDPINKGISPEESTDEQAVGSYTIIDTGQDHCYSDTTGIPCPQEVDSYFGQDAQYKGIQAAYMDNGDGTVTDLNTGLMWQAVPDLDEKSTFSEALAGAETFELAGYDDWRLPTIKELYSLINFNGSVSQKIPYLNTEYFSFRYGDESQGEREIDAQYWSSTAYVGTTMNGNFTVFGVNFADGRIKGYGTQVANGREMEAFVLYVRGNSNYGQNQFQEQGDGTIFDIATGLVWQQSDSEETLDWEGALEYCEDLSLAGKDDWRLPNAKELQSIVDYTRSPQTSDSAAIDPIFAVTEIESWYWTSTTHLDTSPNNAIYIAFGQAFGLPDGKLVDVHGAGAQRSDPKSGDPEDYSQGRGTEGQDDQIRIYNYARCVRGGVSNEIFLGGEPDTFTGIEMMTPSQEQFPGNPPEPPQEALAACEELEAGTGCSFVSPRGMISGICRFVGSGDLACVPEDPPPQ